jgi:hypothetical protein
MKISNPRVILIENIRQTCVFYTYSSAKCKNESCKAQTMIYWDYMAEFSDICANLDNPIFTEKCANLVIENLNLDKYKIDECVKNMVEKSKTL